MRAALIQVGDHGPLTLARLSYTGATRLVAAIAFSDRSANSSSSPHGLMVGQGETGHCLKRKVTLVLCALSNWSKK